MSRLNYVLIRFILCPKLSSIIYISYLQSSAKVHPDSQNFEATIYKWITVFKIMISNIQLEIYFNGKVSMEL